MSAVYFDIYKYKLKIESADFDVNQLKIIQDFDFFIQTHNEQPNLEVNIFKYREFKKKGILIGSTRMCKVRQISLSKRQLIYTYNGETLAVVEDQALPCNRKISLWAKNPEVIDDILYFLINSCVGEHLDLNSYMRIHALSCQSTGKTSLIYGLPGAGKSTLAAEILQNTSFRIFSDEISILNLNSKTLLPYPIRVGISNQSSVQKNTDVKFVYFFETKFLVKIPQNKISSESKISHFFYLSQNPVSSAQLAAQLVSGVGLIQMWEYFLRPNNLNSIFKIFINRLKLVSILFSLPRKHLQKNLNPDISVNYLS